MIGDRQPEPRVLRDTRQHTGEKQRLNGGRANPEAIASQLVDWLPGRGPCTQHKSQGEGSFEDRFIEDLEVEKYDVPRGTLVLPIMAKDDLHPGGNVNEGAFFTPIQGLDNLIGLQRFDVQEFRPFAPDH